MFQLMNQFHNSIDGSFCWGILQYEDLHTARRDRYAYTAVPSADLRYTSLKTTLPGAMI